MIKSQDMPLAPDKRQETDCPRLFYGARQTPLMFGANARVPRVYDLALAGNKTLQEFYLLVINLF